MTVHAKKRKNMKHLHDMNDYDFCRWIMTQEDGQVILNWKLDGFFLRFGKDTEGRPWFQTARSDVLYDPTEIILHSLSKGYDHQGMTRAENYYHLIKTIWDSQMFADMDSNTGYACEVFDRSMATLDGKKITFVNVPYREAKFYRTITLHRYSTFFSDTGATFLDSYPDEVQYDKEFGLYGSAFVLELDFGYFREAVRSLTEEGICSLKSLRHADRPLKLLVREKVAEIKKQLKAYVISEADKKNKLGELFEGVVLRINNVECKIVTDEFATLLAFKDANYG